MQENICIYKRKKSREMARMPLTIEGCLIGDDMGLNTNNNNNIHSAVKIIAVMICNCSKSY